MAENFMRKKSLMKKMTVTIDKLMMTKISYKIMTTRKRDMSLAMITYYVLKRRNRAIKENNKQIFSRKATKNKASME
jgi:hypothetical protein